MIRTLTGTFPSLVILVTEILGDKRHGHSRVAGSELKGKYLISGNAAMIPNDKTATTNQIKQDQLCPACMHDQEHNDRPL